MPTDQTLPPTAPITPVRPTALHRPRSRVVSLIASLLIAAFAIPTFAIEPTPAASAPATPPLLKPRDRAALAAAEPMKVYEAACERAKNVDQEGEPGGEAIKYLMRLPVGFKMGEPRNLVIILHPQLKDRTWGFDEFPPATFRPNDIIVCLDGTTRTDDGQRVFALRYQDGVPMRNAVLDITRVLPTARIVLLGTEDSGLFVLNFAASFPRVIDGVVVLSSGAMERTPTKGGIAGVPIVFVHSPVDERVGYLYGVDARDAYLRDGHPTAFLRRIDDTSSAPEEAKARKLACVGESLDYVLGMSSKDPAEVLTLVRSLLTPKPNLGDHAPPFGMARHVLRRFEPAPPPPPLAPDKPKSPAPTKPADPADPDDEDAPRPMRPTVPVDALPPPDYDLFRRFTDATEDHRRAAFELSVLIEKQAQRHLSSLRTQLMSPKDLTLTLPSTAATKPANSPTSPTPPDWLGHLLPFREDFRGVESVESFIKELTFDQTLATQRDPAAAIWEVFMEEKPPEQVFRTVAEQLPSAFLIEGLPPKMIETVAKLKADAVAQNIPEDLLARYPQIDRYARGLSTGLAAYRTLLRDYQPPTAPLPPPRPAP